MSFNADNGITISKPFGDSEVPTWKAEGFRTPGRYQQSLRMRAYWAGPKGQERRGNKREVDISSDQ